jgi:hypothetical protein
MRLHLFASGVFLIACLAMAQTWASPWVWPLLSSCLVLMLMISRDIRDLGFFGMGVVLGGFIDLLQTGAGVTVYAISGPILLFPSFVLLYWGLAGMALRHMTELFPKVRFHPADGGLFVGAILLSLFGNAAPLTVAGLLLVALAIHLAFLRRWADGLMALALMMIGPLTESMLIRQGLYHFPSSGDGLIAIWLYPLYGCIGASFRGIVPVLEAVLQRLRSGIRKPSVGS